MDVVTLDDLPEPRRETLLWKRAWWMTYEEVDEWVRERAPYACLRRPVGTWDAQAARAVLGDDGRFHLVGSAGVLCGGGVFKRPTPLAGGKVCGTRVRHKVSVTWVSDGTPLRAGTTLGRQQYERGEVWFESAEVTWQVILTDVERVPSLTQQAERCPGYLREWPAPLGTSAVARVRARLIEQLGEACHACGSLPGVHVDHDHVTGQVRGLLCADCNTRVDNCPHPRGCLFASYLELRLSRAQRQQTDLRQQLARAEKERDTAQQVADHAARRMQELETELAALREWMRDEDLGLAQDLTPQVPPPGMHAIRDDDAALDDVDLALQKARAVLDEEHDAIQQAADDMGYRTLSLSASDDAVVTKIVPGQLQHVPKPESLHRAAEAISGLSRTTPDNPATSSTVPSPVTESPRLSADRLRYIGAATRRIARGMDLDEVVMGLCRATVPTFADTTIVYLREPLPVGDERPIGPLRLRLRRVEPPELPALIPGLCEVRPGSALAEVLRGVRPLFADAPTAQAALPELLGDSGVFSVPTGQRAILAPLRGQRRVIGVALFLRDPQRIPFQADDLLVAAQLATHSALGVDRTVLDGHAAYIADELQRTMLPETLPRPTGVRLASRYLPAAETARVGGDWYDAIPLPGSRVALVVGDVMGHSVTSAAIMGQLRTTAQNLAGLDLPPQEVLHHLDEQAQRLGTDRMATCLYAVYDPVSHRITIANAGHPPPVLLHLGGRAEVLRVPPGAPIGVGGVDFEAVELDAPAGATLLLYTDGLVESRLRDAATGIEQLREKLEATAQLTGPDHPPPLEALCDEVLDMLGPGDRDDDIALLAARFDGIAPSDVAYWFLEPEDAAPGRARRLARQALARWELEELTDSVELLVSEVVTNAVRYATRPVTLRLLRIGVLRCEVGDDVPQMPRLRQAHPTDEGGRGLYLVNRLARRWGATRLSTGKVVWFELNLKQ